MKRFVAAVALVFCVSVPSFSQKVISRIAVKVNKDIILDSEIKKSTDEIRAELAQDPKLKGAALQQAVDERSKNVVRDLIDKLLVLQQASDLGLDANLEVLKEIEKLRENNHFETIEAMEAEMLKEGISIDEVKDNIRYKNLRSQVYRHEVTGKIVITNEEMRVYYDAHKEDFNRPPGVSIGIIAVSTDGLSDAELAAKKKIMDDALAALKKGEDFADVARKHSEDPSAPNGGTLDFIERNADGTYGFATPEMEEAVAKLPKNQITDVMTNPQNQTLMILKVFDKHSGGILPFETAQSDIYGELMDQRAEPKVREYLTKLRGEGYIEVYPGFVDSGASTKPVRASDTAPPK